MIEGRSRLSLLSAAAEVPERVALVVDGVQLTFGELAGPVREALGRLAARGVLETGAPVALVATNRLGTVVMLYALMEAGVPVVLLHARLTAAEREEVVQDCRPACVLDEGDARTAHADARADCVDVRTDCADDDRPLAILYTSGTTGRPKGAVLSRRALVAAAAASEENLGWQDQDRWLLCMPLGHVGGLSIITRCLRARRCVVLPQWARFDPAELAQVVARDGVTLLSVVPTMLRRLLDLRPAWCPPRHLRAILLGGAAASAALLQEASALGAPVLTTYGLTEACSQVATQRYRPLGALPPTSAEAEPSVGPPVAGTQVRIVKEEIQVCGPALFSGYYSLGAHPDPFLPGGWLPTGDLGYLDQRGELHVLARRTDLIVSGGENVYPAQVEMALERCPHPVILASCVFGVDDQTWGQIVAAALVLEVPLISAADLQALREHVVGHLAPHKRPRLIAQVAALRLTAAGKLDRAATAAAARPALRCF